MSTFSSLLNTQTLSGFVDLVKKQFVFINEMVKPVAQQLYIYDDLTSWSSNQKRYDELDIETFGRLKREGENASKVRGGIGYSKTMTAKRVAGEIDVTWEMRRYGQEHVLKSKLWNLNHLLPQRKELDQTHRLTFASSTSYTDMDGESVDITMGDAATALLSTAQALKFVSTTWSNRVASDPAFSQSSLESAENLFNSDILNNFGERRVMYPNVIITTDHAPLTNDVRKVLESTADVDASHAGVVNVNKGKYRHIILPYLATTATGARDSTKQRWWFLACIGQGVNGWQAYFGEFEKPNLKTPTLVNGSEMLIGEDIHNDNLTFGARGSYGIAIVTGRGIVGSLPTS